MLTMVRQICTNCGEAFDRPVKRGRPPTRCEICRGAGLMVTQEPISVITDGVTMVENAEPCRDCGQVFMRARKRGKPPLRCSGCREAFLTDQVHTTSQETIDLLYSGPADKLKGNRLDLPKGNEAQCPKCWRIFTSDSSCESHKRYQGATSCVDPATLGMEPRERRNLPIWTRPSVVPES